MSKGNGAERAMAQRFYQKARGSVNKNKSDLTTTAGTRPGQTNLWDETKYTYLNPNATLGPDQRATAYMATPTNLSAPVDPSLAQIREQTKGLAGMGKMPDRDDQYFDNVAWYRSVYSQIGGPTDAQKHGRDLGEVFLDDRFFDYLERKKEKEFARRYEWFKLGMVDLKDPANRDYWQKKFPELVEKKLQYYKNREGLRAKFNEISVRGPSTMEDLEFIYLFNLGFFDSCTLDDVSNYLSNPQDRKIWLAAVEQGVIDWNNLSWNENLKEPPSTPMDSLDAQLPYPLNVGNTQFATWQDVPKH